jgi:DNA repair exonuclease SbcCD ATPase subunit
MIRRLQLKSWRAFDALDISFDEGVTFIVAENGVGKTSLIEAAAWALYGAKSGVDGATARRKDAEGPASITIDVELPDGGVLAVTRTTAAKNPLEVRVDGVEQPDGVLEGILADVFGADADYLARVTILPTELLRSYAEETFHLRRHLCQVYGVDALEEAEAHIKRYLTSVVAETKKVRSDLDAHITDEERLSERLSRLDAAIEELDGRRRQIITQLDGLEAVTAAAAKNVEVRAANTARTEEVEGLSARIVDQLGLAVVDGDLEALVSEEERRIIERLDTDRRELAETRGKLDAISTALTELEHAGAECPVCRRELRESDVVHAREAHVGDAGALTAVVASFEENLDDLTVRLDVVRQLQRELSRVPAEQVEVPMPDAAVGFTATRPELQAQLTDVSERLGAARTERTQVQDQIGASVQARSEKAKATQLFRREAFATATQATVQETIKTVLATRVEPVATEVTNRWKRIFGERGTLQLTPEGELKLVRGGFEVPFADFSAGEKVVALLTARLLIVSASTRASFMWLDEPLEHLDPSNRRIVASLLATSSGPVRQILVTTYEEPLARRLVEQVPSVHLQYVRTVED